MPVPCTMSTQAVGSTQDLSRLTSVSCGVMGVWPVGRGGQREGSEENTAPIPATGLFFNQYIKYINQKSHILQIQEKYTSINVIIFHLASLSNDSLCTHGKRAGREGAYTEGCPCSFPPNPHSHLNLFLPVFTAASGLFTAQRCVLKTVYLTKKKKNTTKARAGVRQIAGLPP